MDFYPLPRTVVWVHVNREWTVTLIKNDRAAERQKHIYIIAMTISAVLLTIMLLWLLNPTKKNVNTVIATNPAIPRQSVVRQLASTEGVASNSPKVTHQSQEQSSPSSPSVTTLDTESVVAQINETVITFAELNAKAALDRVIQQFLGQSSSELDSQAELDRLINGELVNQAAIMANFHVAADEYEQALTRWLATHQQTEAALETALMLNGFTPDNFAAHFRYLLTIDRFMAEQTRVSGSNRTVLLQQWQQQAKISFGPAVNLYLTSKERAQNSTAPSSSIATVQPVGQAPELAEVTTKIGPFTLWQDETVAPNENETANTSISINSATATAVTDNSIVTDTRVPTEQIAAPQPDAAATAVAPPVGLTPGNRAPTFTLALLDEENSAVNIATWQGTPIVLSFWTTWCPFCRKQTPILVAGTRTATAGNIQFVGVNVNETRDPVHDYVEKHQIPYPILLDHDGAIATRYAVRGYPTTYFLDANGLIVAKHVGALNATQLARYLSQLQP